MLLEEFAQRTHFATSQKYFFEVIHEDYIKSGLDKDAFCKQWKKQGGYQKAYDAMCEERNEQKKLALKYKRAYEETRDALDEAWKNKNRLIYKLDMIKDILTKQ